MCPECHGSICIICKEIIIFADRIVSKRQSLCVFFVHFLFHKMRVYDYTKQLKQMTLKGLFSRQ